MKEGRRRDSAAVWISSLSVLLSLLALLLTIRYCCPAWEQQLRIAIGGLETGPVRQAFHTMADQLEAGTPIKETLLETSQVLFGTEN